MQSWVCLTCVSRVERGERFGQERHVQLVRCRFCFVALVVLVEFRVTRFTGLRGVSTESTVLQTEPLDVSDHQVRRRYERPQVSLPAVAKSTTEC